MKKLSLFMLSLPIVALILELLPYGAVLNFANPEGEPIRQTYSYFSLTPFGYANFGPFITAVLTLVLIVLVFAYIALRRKKFATAAFGVNIAAILGSLSPLLYGIRAFSIVGCFISLALASSLMLICFLYGKVKKGTLK